MKPFRIAAFTTALLLAGTMTCPAAGAAPAPQNKTYETHDTLSCIGSVSKMFATAAVMQLAEQGKVDLDSPVTNYLPDFRMADPRYRDITVRMLMNHSSGLMGTTAGDFMVFADRQNDSHDTLLRFLQPQRLKADPGDFGAYCNDGFELLELITEAVSGQSFTEYMEAHICKPLDMQQTGTPWNAFETPEQVGCFLNGTPVAVDYCMDLGSGGILSTAPELTRFGSSFFTGDTRLLSERSKKEMQTSSVTDKYEDGFGLGWDQVDYPDYAREGVKVVSKGGDIIGQHASLMVAPDAKISVSVLSAGGSSTCNQKMAMKLMDIALADQGISVEHPAAGTPATLSAVPEEYLAYAGLYINAQDVIRISFPEQKYMELRNLSSSRPQVEQYLCTADGGFLQMDGNIAEGKAVPVHPQNILRFVQRKGVDCLVTEQDMQLGSSDGMQICSYSLQRVQENPVSEAAQAAWDARSGRKYYLYNGRYSNVYYTEMPSVRIFTSPEAPGYVGGKRIVDENHAESALSMPGGRDIEDCTVRQEDGIEFLDITTAALSFISEEAIPELDTSVTEIPLHTGKAAWFSIGDSANRTLTLDIPEHAAVCVYNSYDHLVYTSYMTNYGNSVPLPAGGKIVFLGEDGGTVQITQ